MPGGMRQSKMDGADPSPQRDRRHKNIEPAGISQRVSRTPARPQLARSGSGPPGEACAASPLVAAFLAQRALERSAEFLVHALALLAAPSANLPVLRLLAAVSTAPPSPAVPV